jgi:hypothetical protein
MRTSKKLTLASIFLAIIAFSACQKSNISSLTTETTLATDNARMDNESDNIGAIVNAVAFTNGMSNLGAKLEGPGGGIFGNITLPACATVVVDTVSATKSITIDFGSTPCLCDQWDGLYRQGVIQATWTGGFKDPGTVISVATTNFYRGVAVDQMDKYDIHKTVTNMGPNNAAHLEYHQVATINITFSTGETSSWNIDKTKEWVEGESTSDMSDDVFSITGGGSGTNRNGVAVTELITTPITKTACQWYVSGVAEITRGNLPTITLDYGNGSCDNSATLSVNGQTKTIVLQ